MAAPGTELRTTTDRARPTAARRAGYVVAALINLFFLWFVNQLLGWGWPAFLTESFEDLLPIIDLSIVATIVLNLCWAVRDPVWFRHLGQIALNLIGLVVTVRTWQVFPFDFSAYNAAWETVARGLLVVAFVGLVIATISELVHLATDAEPRRRSPGTSLPAPT